MSESSCKKPNNCSDYVFADCEPEYQDAFMEHFTGYKPREKRQPKQKQCNGQISLNVWPVNIHTLNKMNVTRYSVPVGAGAIIKG